MTTSGTSNRIDSFVIGGVPRFVRIEAPTEVFVGACLHAQLVLTVSSHVAEAQPEWPTLLGTVCCRVSLTTAEGAALLPIASQQELHIDSEGVTIDVRMRMVNLNLADAFTDVRLHAEVTAPSRQYDSADRIASIAVNPFDGSCRGGSALPTFLKHQAGTRGASHSFQHHVLLVQPLRTSSWPAEPEYPDGRCRSTSQRLCNVSVANVHPTCSVQLDSIVVRAAAAGETSCPPWLLTHKDDFPASLPPQGSLLLACCIPTSLARSALEMVLSITWMPTPSQTNTSALEAATGQQLLSLVATRDLEPLHVDLPLSFSECLASIATFSVLLRAAGTATLGVPFIVSVSVTNDSAAASDLVLCAAPDPVSDLATLLCLSAVTPLGCLPPKGTATAIVRFVALAAGLVSAQLELYVQDLDSGNRFELPRGQCCLDILVVRQPNG